MNSENEPRIGNWGLSHTGNKFYPLDMRPSEINIIDIAHSLSNICRFGGHCKKFYSVAQHSVIVANHVSDENKLVALLHDATESYCGDMIRPLKCSMPEFEAIEQKVWAAICAKFGLSLELPVEVREMDARVLLAEKRDILTTSRHEWEFPQCAYPNIAALEIKITPIRPKQASKMFMQAFVDFGGMGAELRVAQAARTAVLKSVHRPERSPD